MKKFTLIFSILILFGLNTKSQEIVNNFIIEGSEILWQKVFETNIKYDELIDNIKYSGIIINMSIADNKISGDLKRIEADYKGAGYTEMRTPIIIARSFIEGFVIIDFKESKYRITIKKIVFTQKYDDPLTKQDEKTTLEFIGVNRKNEFSNAFKKSASEILNYTFTNKFSFPEKKEDNW